MVVAQQTVEKVAGLRDGKMLVLGRDELVPLLLRVPAKWGE